MGQLTKDFVESMKAKSENGIHAPLTCHEENQLFHAWLKCAAATETTRKIHEALKRGQSTEDHGLLGNLACIYDHILSLDDPEPLA